MHHIHCVARSLYTGAEIAPGVHGTIIVLPTFSGKDIGEFDYADSMYGKGILLKLGEFAVIAVLDDSCAAANIASNLIKAIRGPLTPFQLRELLAHLAFINFNLAKRPRYYSDFSIPGKYKIQADLPETWEMLDEKDQIGSVGKILRYYVQDMMPEQENKGQMLKEIEDGRRAYLFDQNGDFVDHSDSFASIG